MYVWCGLENNSYCIDLTFSVLGLCSLLGRNSSMLVTTLPRLTRGWRTDRTDELTDWLSKLTNTWCHRDNGKHRKMVAIMAGSRVATNKEEDGCWHGALLVVWSHLHTYIHWTATWWWNTWHTQPRTTYRIIIVIIIESSGWSRIQPALFCARRCRRQILIGAVKTVIDEFSWWYLWPFFGFSVFLYYSYHTVHL